MTIKVGRIILAAVLIEAIAIAGLVLLVAVLGPSQPDAAKAFAVRHGYWFGPVAGFVLCLAGGWLFARKLRSHQVLNGFALGVVVAAIDVVLLVAGNADFEPVFVVSNLGKVLAGILGGWLAAVIGRNDR